MNKETQRAVFRWRRAAAFIAAALLVSAPSMGGETAAPGSYVNFSFDQVDIRAFVKLVGEVTGRAFIVDPEVEGKVTIVTPPISVDQVYPLFVTVLESAGCSVVREGEMLRVVSLTGRTAASAPVVGVAGKIPADGVVTKVFHLQYVSAADVRKMLEGKVAGAKGGSVASLETTNHLIVTDTADSLRKIEQIIGEIDKPGLDRITQVVALQYANAEEMSQQLMAAMAEAARPGEQLARRLPRLPDSGDQRYRGLVVVAAPHSNSLVLVGTPADVQAAGDLIRLMDVEPPSGRGRLHAIFLKYISAEEAAKSLTALLDKTTDKKAETEPPRKIVIEASPANNALLVDALPRDFELVRELVAELDQLPQQVLIEVLIAEVSLSDSLDVGVEMAGGEAPSTIGDTVLQGSTKVDDGTALMNAVQNGMFPRGITIGVAQGSSVNAEGQITASYPALLNVNAVKKDSKVRILSHIPLLAQDNREASVSVVQNIPLLKSTIEGGSGTARDVIQNIDRVDVGIKLKLTPHINPAGEVRMVLNPSIEAIVDVGLTTTEFTPTIAKREISTTVTVPDGKTIVLSGLIREDQGRSVRKIPILGSIPFLGWLFRHTIDSKERTNLLVLVTPHIVTGEKAAEAVRQRWENATGVATSNVAGRAAASN